MSRQFKHNKIEVFISTPTGIGGTLWHDWINLSVVFYLSEQHGFAKTLTFPYTD